MDKLWGVILAEIAGPRAAAPAPELLREMLIDATRAQRYQLHWHILPYKIAGQGNQFTTITANLTMLPWMLLDLRGRLQPFLLRIGVGIGEMKCTIQEPATSLDGQAVQLARQAIKELRIPHSRQQTKAARGHQLAGKSGRSRIAAPLTRFCSINYDFDDTANSLYALQDRLVHKMRRSEWKIYVMPATAQNPQKAPIQKSLLPLPERAPSVPASQPRHRRIASRPGAIPCPSFPSPCPCIQCLAARIPLPSQTPARRNLAPVPRATPNSWPLLPASSNSLTSASTPPSTLTSNTAKSDHSSGL